MINPFTLQSTQRPANGQALWRAFWCKLERSDLHQKDRSSDCPGQLVGRALNALLYGLIALITPTYFLILFSSFCLRNLATSVAVSLTAQKKKRAQTK
jgi:hypothetical protein